MGQHQPLGQHQPPGRIHGRVVRAADGTPVPKASVRVWDDIVAIDLQTTNARGEFTSRLLFAGSYKVEAEYEGEAGSTEAVEVHLQRTTSVTVKIA